MQKGLAYRRHGTGEPLVLLHGIGHRRQAWNAVVDLLAPHRHLILVDLPGHGESPPMTPDGRSIPTILRDSVIGLLDELELKQPHMAGSSLGGMLALQTAAAGRAASVTALSPAGFWTSGRELSYVIAVNQAMRAIGRRVRPFGRAMSRSSSGRAIIYASIVAKPSRVSPEQAWGDLTSFLNSASAMQAILAAPIPFTDAIPGEIPVTIAWGTKDRLLLPRQAQLAKARLPQASIIWLPGCGHVPITDDPQLVADVLLRGSRARLAHQRQNRAAL